MKENKEVNVNYFPAGPTIKSFHESESFVRGIMGPFGSSKSTACTIELLRRAGAQSPDLVDGKRKTRWAVIRNSYPELKTTTIKTWNQWVPSHFGKMTWGSPIRHHVITPDLDMEVLFLALDRPDDVQKLLSLELTGAWVNEAREIPRSIIDGLTGRVGRYPAVNMGGCDWSGIIMDTNPPDDQSWWYQFAEKETPKGWAFFKQPSGLSAEAENRANLPPNYYERMAAGKDEDWIKVYIEGEYGFVTEGKAVYPMYRDSIHCAKADIEPVAGLPLLLGVDFGLTPAAVIGQKLIDGRWLILDEYMEETGGLINFSKNLLSYVSRKFPNFIVDHGWGDPAGKERGRDDLSTAFKILKEYTGWEWSPAPGQNDLGIRLEVVTNALSRLIDGNPGILVSPKAGKLRKGFAGGYAYKYLLSGDGTQTTEKPTKNRYSHPHDGLQYLLLGGGEHAVVMRKAKKNDGRPKIRVAHGTDYDIFGHR